MRFCHTHLEKGWDRAENGKPHPRREQKWTRLWEISFIFLLKKKDKEREMLVVSKPMHGTVRRKARLKDDVILHVASSARTKNK